MGATVQWGSSPGSFPYGFIITSQKEYMRNTEGSALALKRSITIKGAVDAGATGSATGALSLVDAISSPSDPTGRQVADLKITNDASGTPVDMLGGTLSGARLVSASVGEPPEDTAGIQYVEVTATWEIYSAGDYGYALQSASDTLEVKKEEDKSTSAAGDLSGGGLTYGYTVTHTVTAQGINTGGMDGYAQAKGWVESRAGDTTATLNASGGTLNGVVQTKDGNGNVTSTTGGVTTSSLGPDLTGYGQYNAMKSTSTDIANGSYTVTTSYFKSAGSAFIDVTSQVQRDESGEMSVSCQGTIQGLSSGGPDSTTDNRFANAQAAYGAISGDSTFATGAGGSDKTIAVSPLRSLDIATGLASTNPDTVKTAQAAAADLFKKPGTGTGTTGSTNASSTAFGSGSKMGAAAIAMWGKGPTDGMILDVNYPITYSVGHNPPKGTITFSVTYKAYTSAVMALKSIFDALTASLNISYENKNTALIQTIAIIPVIGRAAGPVIQDMGTTKEKRKIVQIEAITKPTNRPLDNSAMIDAAIGICLGYAPEGTAYRSGSSGSWDAATGRLSAQVEWTFE
jgi:hypothetical protein